MSVFPKLKIFFQLCFQYRLVYLNLPKEQCLIDHCKNVEWRDAFQHELYTAANDPNTSWMNLLCNDEYEVTFVESESEARDIAMSLLWQVTFPDQSIPILNNT